MYGNYGNYNGYMGQQRFQPMEQTIQPQISQIQPNMMLQRQFLNGKQVESVDVVKSIDIPLDGSINYFPIADGTMILTKQLQLDGTSKTLTYKLVTDDKQITKFITSEDLEKEIKKLDLSDLDDLKEEIKEIKKSLKDIKKKGD